MPRAGSTGCAGHRGREDGISGTKRKWLEVGKRGGERWISNTIQRLRSSSIPISEKRKEDQQFSMADGAGSCGRRVLPPFRLAPRQHQHRVRAAAPLSLLHGVRALSGSSFLSSGVA
ncbi:unnamed protein product [Urochloa humidicola]